MNPLSTTGDVVARLRVVAIGYDRRAIALLTGPHPFGADNVHDVRVLVKRLRALWRAVEPGIGRTARRQAEAGMRSVHRSLGHLRDNHVMGETLRQLIGRADDEDDRDALLAVHRELFGDGRRRSSVHLAPPEPTELAAVFARDAVAWQEEDRWDGDDLADGIRGTYRAARKHARAFLDGDDREDLHDWRTETKRLLYQLDALDITDDVCPRRRRDLAKLGSILGKRNDLTVLIDALTEDAELLPERKTVRRCIGLLEQRDRQLHRRCRRLHDELFRPKPREFIAGLAFLFDDTD